jgi:hypothetical protein
VSGLLAGAALTTAHNAFGQVYFEESFNTGFFASLPTDWVIQNNSSPIGVNSWFQGFPDNFPSFNGTPDAYASVNFNSGGGVAEINNWLVTPVINAPAGSRVSFVTRNFSNTFPDRLELRSSNGSTNVGSSSSDFGDFNNLLVSIDPDLLGIYPTTWTRFEVTLPSAFSGRLGFRYWVTDGGPGGSNSDTIGIDALHVSDPSEPLPAPNPPPSAPPSIAAVQGGSLTGTISEVGQLLWYKFDWSGGAFAIDTVGTNLSADPAWVTPNDTELGLYTATGELVTDNDDISFGDDNFLSAINLPNLNAGTYYVVVGGWGMNFGAADWNVTTTGQSRETGTIVINGLSLAPAPEFVVGDFNFDGGVDASDIDPFVVVANEGGDFATFIAANQAAFEALYPGQTLTPEILNSIGDFNGDEGLDSSDIDPFVPFANNGGARISPIPEPAALGLLAPIGLLLRRRR